MKREYPHTKRSLVRKYRSRVGDSFEDVINYAFDHEMNAIDSRKLMELEGRYGTNGGVGCDVREGPCSCGAWHHRDEKRR